MNYGRKHSVLMISSGPLIWPGVHVMLQRQSNLEVLREVYGLEEGIWSAEAQQPDLILVSTELARTRLVGLITDLRTHAFLSKVVAVGEVLEPETHRQLAAAGLDGHLVWDDLRPDAMLYGIGAVLDGNLMIASRQSVAQLLQDTHQVTAPSPQLALAEDERRVLELLAGGLNQREISEVAHMSLREVQRAAESLRTKFDAPTLFVVALRTLS